MKKKILGLLGIMGMLALASCTNATSTTKSNTNQGATVTGNNEEVEITEDTVTSEFTLKDESGNEITAVDGRYTISTTGVYTAEGKLSSGQIYVDGADQDIELDLNGVSITNSSLAPIFVNDCADFTLKSLKDTTNYIYDTRTTDYSALTDAEYEADANAATGAIYVANGDLKINGKGTLQVTSSANSGIHGKDNVTVKNVTMLVQAQNNGIKGNDKVTIEEDPTLGIVAGNNGISTSNSEVGTQGAQHGYIYIYGGTITINSYGDGIDAAYAVEINTSTDTEGNSYSPDIDIYTNIYSSYENVSTASYSVDLYGGPGGNPFGDQGNGFDGGGMQGGSSAEKADDSAKAIKANETIDIKGGDIFTYTYDDGIHANNDTALDSGTMPSGNVNISGGTIEMKASDDGIHADGTLTISGGTVYVSEAYEGIEGNKIVISGGDTTVFADNDGINASTSITVSGGRVDVNMPASGDVDGIDSNGSFTVTGGVVIARGPNSEMAAPVDCDGTISYKGGVVIIVGYAGNASTSLTKTTGSATSSGSHTVTVNGETISFSNSYSYSGSTTVYASGSATIK